MARAFQRRSARFWRPQRDWIRTDGRTGRSGLRVFVVRPGPGRWLRLGPAGWDAAGLRHASAPPSSRSSGSRWAQQDVARRGAAAVEGGRLPSYPSLPEQRSQAPASDGTRTGPRRESIPADGRQRRPVCRSLRACRPGVDRSLLWAGSVVSRGPRVNRGPSVSIEGSSHPPPPGCRESRSPVENPVLPP